MIEKSEIKAKFLEAVKAAYKENTKYISMRIENGSVYFSTTNEISTHSNIVTYDKEIMFEEVLTFLAWFEVEVLV